MACELLVYEGVSPLTIEVRAETFEDRTCCVISSIHKGASHVLFFKLKRNTVGKPDLSSLGEPERVGERYDIMHNRCGRFEVPGDSVAEYLAVPAFCEGGPYYCDMRCAKKLEIGDHSTVQYKQSRRGGIADGVAAVTVQFLLSVRGGRTKLPLEDLCYTVDAAPGVKYPIHPKMLKDNAFSVYVPERSAVRLANIEGAKLRIAEVR